MILEGYFVFSPEFYKDKTGFYLAEVCKFLFLITTVLNPKLILRSLIVNNHQLKLVGKEYSKGDSRYAARDAGVVTVEGLTAVLEGPASLLAV